LWSYTNTGPTTYVFVIALLYVTPRPTFDQAQISTLIAQGSVNPRKVSTRTNHVLRRFS